jgi:hypothetical protein
LRSSVSARAALASGRKRPSAYQRFFVANFSKLFRPLEKPSLAVHCIDLVYPQDVPQAWNGIVTRISRSLRPLEG